MTPVKKRPKTDRNALGSYVDPMTGRLPDEDDPWGDGSYRVEPHENPLISKRPSLAGSITLTNEQIDRFHDMMIVRLFAMKFSIRTVAKLVKLDKMEVLKRHKEIPENVKNFYATTGPMESLAIS